ncbi:uncharacterized protein EAE98_012199 [Botrytis deweyae]|uniref:F-box domain-containing protein n=1 Tax=Botrytis deweyae TaxID=2478750 RepID=A0ABQ7I3Z0_9HELO|nr:uncharacterized protein EAE98_012199 [Botrytis deweyae]KAF7910244.1 hypothetical protein EAE98_012199 [Botrytis deweyae]
MVAQKYSTSTKKFKDPRMDFHQSLPTNGMLESNSSPGWEDIFLCYPIFDNICTHLDPNEILLLRATTKQLSPLFESLFKTQWNVNLQLKRFIEDPITFRSKLATYNALISGSFALQFFERRFWQESDLDIYVNGSDDSESHDRLDEYLVNSEGYKLQPAKEDEGNDLHAYAGHLSDILEVKTYLKMGLTEEKPLQIQLILTTDTPWNAIINGFNHTVVVNVISWNLAYSFFPRSNFIDRTTYELKGTGNLYSIPNGNLENTIAKYEHRGWRWETAMAYGEWRRLRSLKSSSSLNEIEDYSKIWTITLDTDGINDEIPLIECKPSVDKEADRGLDDELRKAETEQAEVEQHIIDELEVFIAELERDAREHADLDQYLEKAERSEGVEDGWIEFGLCLRGEAKSLVG